VSARRRTRRLGNRALIALGLVAFVVITSVVVWRRSIGVGTAREMARLQTQTRELRSDSMTLERDITAATSNRRVVTEAQRTLGMHLATEQQMREVVRAGTAADSVARR
jgi:hypothetical protein